MATFHVRKQNIGTEDNVQNQVAIYITDCGVTRDGHRLVIPNCVVESEVDEEVDKAIERLNAARMSAKRILSKNFREVSA